MALVLTGIATAIAGEPAPRPGTTRAEPGIAAAPTGLPTGTDLAFRSRMLDWRGPDAPPPTAIAMPLLDGEPVDGPRRLSSGFGMRADPFGRGARRHAGVDIPGLRGTPVRATGPGVVSFAGTASGYGNMVEVDHGDGVRTRYAHLSRIDVRRGTGLDAGRPIGRIGSTGRSTGDHLHYEVRVNGRAVDPDRAGGLLTLVARARVFDQPEVAPRWAGWTGTGTTLPLASFGGGRLSGPGAEPATVP